MIDNKIDSIVVSDNRSDDVPFITVIIPTFKRVELLSQTLDSLVAQNNKSFEVVIVDNDSDNSVGLDQLVDAYNNRLSIALFRNLSNLGMFGNWDRGMLLARTKWVTILHDDDLFAPSFINDTQYLIEKFHKIQLLLFRSAIFYGDQNPLRNGSLHEIKNNDKLIKRIRKTFLKNKLYRLTLVDYFFKNEHMGTLGAVFKRDNALAINGFIDNYGYASDYAFFIEYCKSFGEVYLYNNYATLYRYSVNESLNYEVLVSFIDEGKKIRKNILDFYKINNRLGLTLNSIATASQISRTREMDHSCEFIDTLVKDLIRQSELSPISYNFFRLLGSVLYNLYQIRRLSACRCPFGKRA